MIEKCTIIGKCTIKLYRTLLKQSNSSPDDDVEHRNLLTVTTSFISSSIESSREQLKLKNLFITNIGFCRSWHCRRCI